jgi:hypothetical protein
MAFTFKTVGQEIAVWHILNRPYGSNINKAFYDAVTSGRQVELNNGFVNLVKHETGNYDDYNAISYLVFDYNGSTYRMDVDEYDSWDEDSDVSEPYLVVAVPVNEVQYVRRKV